jgi:hypothetical protein
MDRKGAIIAIDTLIQLAIVLVVFLVVFLGVFPVFQQKLEAAQQTSACEWSVLLSALRKGGSAGIAEGIPEGCHTKIMKVTMDDLKKRQAYARKRIAAYASQPQYQGIVQTFVNDNENTLNEFAVDNIVADEMVSCWDKVYKGKMPLFDEWWRLYTVPWAQTENDPKKAVDTFADSFGRAPVNCILCANIQFDNTVLSTLPKDINSLEEWMSINPVQRTGTDYLTYILDGQPKQGVLNRQPYRIKMSEQGLAIIYTRVNEQAVIGWLSKIPQWMGITSPPTEPSDLNLLYLVPYTQDDIVSQKGIGCTLLLD